MSLVGNFAFNNYDATADRAGAPTPGHVRRGSIQYFDDPSTSTEQPQQPPRGLHRMRSSYSAKRRRSTATSRPPEDEINLEKPADVGKGEEAIDDSLSDDEEDKRREEEVHALARKLTKQSSFAESELNPFDATGDSKLNPHSEHFNGKSWAKAMLNQHLRDPKAHPLRTAGLAFRNLNVFGYGISTDYQKDVSNVWLEAWGFVQNIMRVNRRRIDILRDFEGVINAGEMLVVLGPPGSGCSTLLKTIAGETHGFTVDPDSYLNYQGISAAQMHKDFRGEAIYTAEVDVHFPMLTVADTLTFAARARLPRHVPGGVKKTVFADHVRDVVMAIFGISHTINTRVGNEYVRGISGGERKYVDDFIFSAYLMYVLSRD